MNHQHILDFVRKQFNEPNEIIPLHVPVFNGNEKKYVLDCIDSTYVSSVGEYVTRFEQMMCEITGAKYAVAITNGTLALHLAMQVAGVKQNDEVLSQSLTFIATANAISYLKAHPVFLDIDKDTLGLSPHAVKKFLDENCFVDNNGYCINKKTSRRVAACVPMHTFGLPMRIDELVDVCAAYNIPVVEDAAESIGSYYKNKHTGTFGLLAAFSFNGNKTVTCGGGGCIITNDEAIAKHAKHLSTQAKVPHAWEFIHDEVGYNYRLPNINAALACAQLEQLCFFVDNKRTLSKAYQDFFKESEVQFVPEIENAKANYWLNAVLFTDKKTQQAFLKYSNENKIMCRPVWRLMNELPMFAHCQADALTHSKFIADRLVNLPSSVRG